MGTNPVTCTALDQCHVPGTCNSADGTCDNPAVVGAADACGRGGKSGGGGAGKVTCWGHGAWHLYAWHHQHPHTYLPPLCLPPPLPPYASCLLHNLLCRFLKVLLKDASATSMPPEKHDFASPQADSTTCNDGDACTQTDTCSSGVCHGSNPVTCTASDQCHDVGTCNPADGSCSNPQLVRGDGALNLNWCVVCMLGHATTAVAYHRAYMLGLATVAVAYPRAHMLGLATIAVTYPHSLLQRPHSPTAF